MKVIKFGFFLWLFFLVDEVRENVGKVSIFCNEESDIDRDVVEAHVSQETQL